MPSDTSNDLIHIDLTVNGRAVSADVQAQMPLVDFLRDHLLLTGTKNGCDSGHCGACTVLVAAPGAAYGKATRACLVKMGKLAGCAVETVEGLAPDGQLHPLQRAFIDLGGVQCGFCTPGMLMAAKGLLDANPSPTLAQIKQALTQSRNLCRCTGYVNILRAIQAAAGGGSAVDDDGSRNLLKSDAVAAVTGRLGFAADLRMEGMLYGSIRWADHPRARILAVHTADAEALAGVRAVITARDIPGKNQAGIIIRDQPAIAADTVNYIGDAVAAVFAESPEAAAAAARAIQVDYEVLPGVFTPAAAAAPDAPRVHPHGNLLHHATIERGDVEAAFAECAVVVEGTYTTPHIEHAFMEPEAGLAFPNPEGGVTIQIGTQCAFDDRTQLAEILALPENLVRVVQLPMGGAFGGREDLVLQQFLALGALKTGQPVKMVLSREESLRVHAKRHPARMHYKTGASADGRLLAIQSEVTLDTGAYASLGVDVLENALVFGAGPYYVPNLRLEGWSWYTNNVLAGAMRGFGVNQVAVALEQQVDELARKLGLDPFEFRRRNALRPGLPTAADHVLEPGVVAIEETIDAAEAALRQLDLPRPVGNRRLGIGVASAVKNIGYGHGLEESAGAEVALHPSGCATLRISQHEYGQGSRAALARLVQAELGVPLDDINVVGPDTAVTPPTGPTTASRQTFLTGNATVLACRDLKAELLAHAAEVLDVEPDGLELRPGRVVAPGTGREMRLADLGRTLTVARRYAPPRSTPLLEHEASHLGRPDFESRPTHWCYAYSTQVAVVEVDPDTGAVQVLKLISANDVGKILNRQAIEGQVHGGVMMGLGYALSERYRVQDGVNLTRNLHDCRLPTAADTPDIVPVLVEVPHPLGPQGAKGFAECPSLATAPAILNAIHDAVGVRIHDLPADKAAVRAALQADQQVRHEQRRE